MKEASLWTLAAIGLLLASMANLAFAESSREECINIKDRIYAQIELARETPCVNDQECDHLTAVGFACYAVGHKSKKAEIQQLIAEFSESGCIIPPMRCLERYSKSEARCIEKRCVHFWE